MIPTFFASGTYSGLMAYGTVSSASLTLQGGTYDLSGTGRLCPSASYNSGSTFRNDCQLVLDGVTVTDVAAKDPYHPILIASCGGKTYLDCVDWIEANP